MPPAMGSAQGAGQRYPKDEGAVQFTDRLLVGLLEAAPDAMVCVDAGGRIVLVNAQTERLFGYRRDELTGRPVEILVPDAIKAGHPARRAGYLADPRPRPMGEGLELAGRRRDGSTFPAEISLSAIDTDEGLLVMAAVRDVTERREAAATAARLASIIQSSHDAVFGESLDRVITSWNPGAERLYGYSAAEMIGRHIDVLIPSQTRAEEMEIPAAITRGERVEQFQSDRVRKDGTTIKVSMTLSPIADRAGTIVGLSTVSRDITGQQRADARFRGLLEAAPDAMVCVDAGGRIVLVNAQTERLFGYRRDELAGQPVEILVPDAIKAGHPARRAAYVADPRPRQMGEGIELAGRRRDGSTFPAEISLSAIDADEGILVMAAVRDVTERQRAEARFRGLLEAAPDAVVCVDAGGRIVLVNAQTERLFGYRREELAGQPVEILVPDAIKAGHPVHRAGYVADPRPRQMGAGIELAGRRRDGSTFPAEISLSAIDTGEGILVSAAVRDVSERLELQAERERLKTQTERDRLERQLHQSQRLESLGQLAGGVAHDFNNLLAVISNYAAFVAEEVASRTPQDEWQAVRQDIQQIERAAERAAALTHQLLAFARRDVIQPRSLNLNYVIEGIEQLLVRTLGEHVELSNDLAAGLSPVLADPGQIEQVLVNLAVNARDAMPAGGKLIIATTSTNVDADHAASRVGLPPGGYVSLKISDTGTGMPQEVIDRAFEPFFTTKAKGEGTGLGLATVYGIVSQLGGYVQIYSEPGLGTTFTILLPETSRPAEEPSSAPSARRGGSGETVLVVEDEAAMREVTRRILTRNGYQVITAVNGLNAIEVAASHPGDIDVLVTDVVMPQMLGKEAADRIRALYPAVAVLFMSGYTQGVLDTQGVLEAGVNLIEKPFTEASLLAKLHEIVPVRS